MARRIVDVERLRAALRYNPDTGLFTRLERNGGVLPGADAGRASGQHYATFKFDGQDHRAHNLAWVWMTGLQVDGYIDHINGIRSDNRWSNLRQVTASENAQNTAPRKNTHSGLRGVYPASGKWIGRICLHGVRRYLGIYDTPEEAHAAYLAARAELFPKAPVPREYLDLDLPPPLPPYVMGQRETPVIKVGQRWETSGRKGRTFEVVEIDGNGLRVRLLCEQSNVRCWASLSRFGRAGGYKFIAKPAGDLEFESWIEALQTSANAARKPIDAKAPLASRDQQKENE